MNSVKDLYLYPLCQASRNIISQQLLQPEKYQPQDLQRNAHRKVTSLQKKEPTLHQI